VLAPPLPLLLSQLSRNPQVFGIKLNHLLAFEAHGGTTYAIRAFLGRDEW
jgi:hypothetical protein